ncbi:MAG: branched-chain amino acid transaminase [Candidatus Thermoplasmatota archaeon]|jgi:branched-chain amino acid aminotransferase|nr:branched-chain amino acid transaminase [Candidatus Thermoplasmatota archaeon]MCL5681269.1 branched-chain amino acid transaminase [Candidatus Thermoplasmatota archaeon]
MPEVPKTVWLNGKIKKFEDANISILSHGLHYGTGIFEGIRSYKTEDGPAIFRLDDHVKRFFQSARIYSMNLNRSENEIREAILDISIKNNADDSYIRPLAFYSSTKLGLHPSDPDITIAIIVSRLDLYMGKTNDGIRTKISPWRKIDSTALPSMAKGTGQYLSSYLSSRDAKMDGYNEAILLDRSGYVCEGPGENIFSVKNGQVYTPSLESPILAGITRDTVIKIMGKKNQVVEKRIGLSELLTSDEAFFAGTAAEITPISEISGYKLNSSNPHSISNKVKSMYFDVVRGKNGKFKSWLTYLS